MSLDRSRLSGFVLGFVVSVTAAVVVIVVWAAISGLQARSTAIHMQESLAAAADAAGRGDEVATADGLEGAAKDAAALHGALSSAPWTWIAGVPLVGDSVSSLSVIAGATDDVLTPLGSRAWVRSAATVMTGPKMPAVMEALAEARPTLAAAAEAAEANRSVVAAVDVDSVVGPLRDQVAGARERLLALADFLPAAKGASESLPTVFGANGPRRWLVVLQSPGEARGTGGLVGAYSLVRVVDGRIRSVVADSNNSLKSNDIDLAGIPGDTRALWGDDLRYLWGLNLDRHFPFAARLVQRTLPGSPRVDDVIMLDPASVAALMSVTGPVTSHGVRVGANDAREFFTSEIYVRFPDSAKKDAVVVDMLDQTLTRLADRHLDLPRVWRALLPLTAQQHVLIASNDRAVQRGLELMPTSGLVPDKPGPWATAAINDFAGSKMDAYLETEVVYESGSLCPLDGTESTLTFRATNAAPSGLDAYGSGRSDKSGGPPGSTRINVAFYAPLGAQRTRVMVDGGPAAAATGRSRSHPVWHRTLDLKRGETREFSVSFQEPYWPNETPVFQAQPMAVDMDVEVRRPAGC